VYKNDYYGGPFYWTNIPTVILKPIDLTGGGKYYHRKDNQGSSRLVGTYTLFGNTDIRIVPVDEPSQSFTFEYNFDEERELVLSTGQIESIISEKFKTIN
jgi:hypothetical protein